MKKQFDGLPLFAIDDVNIPIDGVATVDLTITNMPEITSCDAVITYDSDVIEIVGMVESDFAPNVQFTDNKVGRIGILAYTLGVLHDGALVVRMQVKPAVGASVNDMCPLALSGTYIFDNSAPYPVSVPHDTEDGIATITGTLPPSQIPWMWIIIGGVAIGIASIIIWKKR